MKIEIGSFIDELESSHVNPRKLEMRLIRKRTGEVWLLVHYEGFKEQTALAIDPAREHVLIDPEALENCGFARMDVNGWVRNSGIVDELERKEALLNEIREKILGGT